MSNSSRAGRKTRPVYTSITGTQPSPPVVTDAGADEPGCSSSGAGTARRASPVDSEGRTYLQISPYYDQFIDAYPTPGVRIGAYWRSRVMHGFWPNWKALPQEEKEYAWEAFKLKFTWTEDIDEGVVKCLFTKQCMKLFRDHIGATKSTYYTERRKSGLAPQTPTWMTDEVFQRFCEHWSSEDHIAKSEQARRNRASSSGSGTKHTMGTINVAEHHMRMQREHGTAVGFVDVFVSTHVRTPTSADQPPQWVDDRSLSAFNAYNAVVAPEGTPPGQSIPFVPDVWQSVTSEGHPKRGDRVLGMGDRGKQCPSSSTGRRSNVFMPDPQYISRIDSLEASVAEERRLAAEDQQLAAEAQAQAAQAQAQAAQYREETDRRFQLMMEQMQMMQQQQQHGSSHMHSSTSSASDDIVRRLFSDAPP